MADIIINYGAFLVMDEHDESPGDVVTSNFPRGVSHCEIRENIENDTIKVSPLLGESTRLLYGGWIGPLGWKGMAASRTCRNLRFGLSM